MKKFHIIFMQNLKAKVDYKRLNKYLTAVFLSTPPKGEHLQ